MKPISRLLLGAAAMTTALVASAASITVTEQRLVDQRIQAEVMSVLTSARAKELWGSTPVKDLAAWKRRSPRRPSSSKAS